MTSNHQSSVLIDGHRFPPIFSAESVRSAQQYVPRDVDVVVATYPKCGTTWTQVALGLVLAEGDREGGRALFHASPFLELKGSAAAETMPRPGIIKTHLPFDRAPWSDKAKYIYVARNPKDCCVSYYYHHLGHQSDLSFDEFFELFLSGDVNFGDYFDHLMSWYSQRNKPNILFLTYEEMKENTEEAILKMAFFINDEKYAQPLRTDSEKLSNVLKFSSLDHIKDIINREEAKGCGSQRLEEEAKGCESQQRLEEEAKGCESQQRLEEEAKGCESQRLEETPSPHHCGHRTKSMGDFLVRKGITGDWKNHFTEEQSKRMDDKFAKRTKGSDIGDLWKNYM